MIEIDGKIVSTDILTVRFSCDLAHCKGICCVEGNAGAPLEVEEVDILETEYDNYKKYMTPEGREVIKREGFMVVDPDGDLTTPLVGDAECAYSFPENGITFCAMERAYRNGETAFKKPISCHLYPIRLTEFSNGSIGLNYHRWGVCSGALAKGEKDGIPMYRSLREPIIRRFGEEFYDTLTEAEKLLLQENEISENPEKP